MILQIKQVKSNSKNGNIQKNFRTPYQKEIQNVNIINVNTVLKKKLNQNIRVTFTYIIPNEPRTIRLLKPVKFLKEPIL